MWVFKVLAVLALCDQLLSAPSERDDQDDDMMQFNDTNSTEAEDDLEGIMGDEDPTTLNIAAEPDMDFDLGEIKGGDDEDEAEQDDDNVGDKGDGDDVTEETQFFSRHVAFMVKRRRGSTLTAPSTLRFEDVVSSTGGGWRGSSGNFVAPLAGMYYFAFHAVAATNTGFTLTLQRNGRNQFTARGTGSREHASNSGVLRLRRGDRVSLRLRRGSLLEPRDEGAYTTFSGFQLFLPFFS